jgi:hypothetical protein
MSLCPVVCRTTSIFRDIYILGVVQVRIRPGQDVVDDLHAFLVQPRRSSETGRLYPRFGIHKNSTGDVVLIVGLVEEYILAISPVRGPIFKDAFTADSVFSAKALPIHSAHWRECQTRSLNKVRHMDFGCHIGLAGPIRFRVA